jgi:hypothetical protein
MSMRRSELMELITPHLKPVVDTRSRMIVVVKDGERDSESDMEVEIISRRLWRLAYTEDGTTRQKVAKKMYRKTR